MAEIENQKKEKKITSEKPVSLAGADFKEVVKPLLETLKPKREKKGDDIS